MLVSSDNEYNIRVPEQTNYRVDPGILSKQLLDNLHETVHMSQDIVPVEGAVTSTDADVTLHAEWNKRYIEDIYNSQFHCCQCLVSVDSLMGFPENLFSRYISKDTEYAQSKSSNTFGDCTTYLMTSVTRPMKERHRITSNKTETTMAETYHNNLRLDLIHNTNNVNPKMTSTFEEIFEFYHLNGRFSRTPLTVAEKVLAQHIKVKVSFKFYSFKDLSTFTEIVVSVEDDDHILQIEQICEAFSKVLKIENVDSCGIDLKMFDSKLSINDV
ncbi:hypothetical protein WICPIJ_006634 [Wickerhamomyces pijperi]|uniref:Uncharacterized protein n=1 Tax=Wickerhamomyces pijperi TaxID=599730 RepID=A0A9P8TKP9_WICPI|nr:hypothetical protein WICPIJ_006634 [Wickerhamomyces pijperi]